MSILPSFADERARYLARNDAALWRPVAEVIAARHGVTGPFETTPRGFHVVLLGPTHAIKLATPQHARDLEVERAALELVDGRLPVATPRIDAAGEVEGWPYLLLSRLGGAPAETVWGALDDAGRARVVVGLGELAAAIHAVPREGSAAAVVAVDWPEYVATRRAAALDKHRSRGLDEAWLADIAAFLDALPPVETWPDDQALLHNDLHLDHIHVELDGAGRPTIVGLLDFADVQAGAREAEFVTLGGFVAPVFRAAGSTFLRAYGLPAADLTPELARRLTGHALIHRYCDIAPILGRYPEAARPRTLAELHRRMWDFAAA
ncbi:MAG: phosphotransferase [Nannocystaceae bacterium]